MDLHDVKNSLQKPVYGCKIHSAEILPSDVRFVGSERPEACPLLRLIK